MGILGNIQHLVQKSSHPTFLFKVFDTLLTPRDPKVSGRLELVLLHTCLLIQHMRYQNDLGLGMMLKGGGREAPSSK